MFFLDERLVRDCLVLGDLPLSRVLLMNDAQYPWLILVPRRAEVSELFDLPESERQQLWREATQLAEGLKRLLGADKMNLANLGNLVSQLHLHVIARFKDDIAWPGPVWGRHPAQPYEAAQIDQWRVRIAQLLGADFKPAQVSL